jgi:hypothetical protein
MARMNSDVSASCKAGTAHNDIPSERFDEGFQSADLREAGEYLRPAEAMNREP